MANNKLPKAQTGTSVPPSNRPTLDESFMQERYGGYRPNRVPTTPSTYKSSLPFTEIYQPKQDGGKSPIEELNARLAAIPKTTGGPKLRTLDQYKGAGRYSYFNPDPEWDNEDAAAQGQGWGSKMVNGVGKGLALTGTTFLQNTVGLVNGTINAIGDGRFASFYDNEFNRILDELNKSLEDKLPNYYTREERDAAWYSPDYWFTGNFLWDGVVKNMGFAAGTYLSAGVYSSALKSLPSASRLFASGKAAETLAATEQGLASANKVAGTYGKIKALSDRYLTSTNVYNFLDKGQRVLVAGLSTTGEAGFEALHNLNEFREGLIQEYIDKNGVTPQGEDLKKINQAADAVGNKTLFANALLLSATNYIQLPKILGSSYTSERGVINGLTSQIDDIVYEGGKYMTPKAKFPLLSKLNKIRPYTFSISEAFEEVSQFAIGVATKDYYTKAYNGKPTDWIDSIGVGVTEGVFTDEGAKNALIGGLSGTIMQARGRYRNNKQKQKITEKALTQLNSTNLGNVISNPDFKFTKFTNETFDAVNRGTVLQQEREQALKDGDILNSKDLEADYIINYLTPRIKYGRYDLVKADINEYRALASTEEGFAQLQAEGKALETDTREAYLERLNRFEQTTENFKSLWQTLNLRYSGEVVKDDAGNPVLTKDGKNILQYPPSVMNQMIYSALKVTDYDKRIMELSSKLTNAGLNSQEIIQQIVDSKVDAFNEAVNTIKNMDVIQDEKDTLGQALDDVAELAGRRQSFIKTYQDIKDNPSKYISEPTILETEPEGPVETVSVKTKTGTRDVEVGTQYFVGKGVDFSKDPLDKTIPISEFTVQKVNEDGSLEIITGQGETKTISPDVFEDLKVGKVSTLRDNKTANYYYNHRNEIFEFNFGKNFGGKRRGRLEYQDGKLYFTYLTPKGKVARKELNNSYFITQEGFDRPRISKVGSIENQHQKDAREQFMSPEEVAKQKATLAKKREARLEVLTQLGEEAKESLEETNKKLAQQTEKLAKIKEDLENIAKMKEAGPTGPKIKLNFSKATKVFTKALNNLTAMQADVDAEIDSLNSQREELELNISYFQDFANQITDAPEDSGEFLRELKSQVALLVDNGKNLNNALSAAKKLAKSTEKAIKSAAKLFRKTLKSIYIVDQEYSQYLSDLLDQVVSGENLLETWPLLKQEMANFALTADLSKDATVDEVDLLNSINDVKQIEKDLADLRTEYKARKIIVDRFQSIMDEYVAQKEAQQELDKRLNKVMSTADNGPATDISKSNFEPIGKKSNEIIYRATVAPETGKDHQVRANQFGINLNLFENRDKVRALFVTSKTQDQLLPGIIEYMLEEDPALIEQYKDSMIVMVMVNENGELVGVDGQSIPEGQPLLDNAIYQAMPEAGFRNGEMFREDTPQEVKDAINEQYKERRDNILEQTALGVPQEIEASFGITQTEENGVTSVQDAGLVNNNALEEDLVLFVPKTNKNVNKGTVAYNTPLGSVFLEVPNGYVKLKNRLHTKKEATAIFDSILKLAKNIIDPNEGISSDSSVRILDFLRGVTYWGIPTDQQGNRKDTGNNSVFFEKVKVEEDGSPISFTKTELVIGSEGKRFPFTPSQLEANKDLIISTLENIYNNANASKTQDINSSFEQILSISPEGEIKSILWPNYQSYLLANKNPDGSKREDFELPLYTNMKPKVEGEMNRKGIYFYTTNTADEFEIPEPKAQAANIPIKQKTSFVLDGKTTNTFTSPQGKKILFRVLPNVTKENYEETIQVLQGGDLNEIVETIQRSNKDPKQQIKQTLYNVIEPQIAKNNAQDAFEEGYAITDEDLPGAPTQPTQQTSEVINIYAGTNENAELSNFAKRPFTVAGETYQTVEAAFQATKTAYAPSNTNNTKIAEQLRGNITGAQAKALGRKITGLETVKWDKDSSTVMKDILIESFKQNPNALQKLLATGNATLTHTQDRGKWGKLFPKILMEVRQELGGSQPTQQTSEVETEMEVTIGTPEQQAEAQQKIDSLEDQINKAISDANSEDLRVKINQEIQMFEPENWTDVESWLKQNFPNVPVYRVKNIIQATNGRQAWGMFKDGAIYVYENAETGTAYHEVFEAVWKMFTTSEEQANILNEFKARKGIFVDRPTGKTVKYSEATPAQIKEQLAEEFRDFVQKKQGVKGLGARIAKLFRELKKFIENALLGNKAQSFTDELFKRIGSGYYKKRMPYATQLSMAQEGIIDIEDAFATSDSEFRIKTLNDRQTSDAIQEMTFLMLNDLIKTDKSLFTIADNINQKDFYEKLLPRVLATIRSKEVVINNLINKTENLSKDQKEKLLAIVAQNRQLERDIVVDWPRLIEKHKEYIKAYDIQFDENDELQLSDEDKIKESNKFDATKIDSFRKANTAIKLLLASNPIVDNNGKAVVSTINGRLLNPVSKMYITLMNKLHTSTSVEDMFERLGQMSLEDPTYKVLYKRLTKQDYADGAVDFSKIESTNALSLISGMWKTFKKQSPDVKNVFIFENGEVAVGDASLSSSANQLRNEYVRSIAVKAKAGKGYFNYNEAEGAYFPNKTQVRKFNLKTVADYVNFLSNLGIPFSATEFHKLNDANKKQFRESVDGIKESILKTDKITSFSTKSLDMNKRLLEIGVLKTAASNPEFSSTYFNLSGERVATFIGPNTASELHNTLSNINNIKELAGTQYEYLLTDVFAKGSNVLNRMFKSDGSKKANANQLLKTEYVGGIVDMSKGKNSPSSNLTQKQRMVQELNLNLQGSYLNLIPGDASIEHMLYMGNPISVNSLARGFVDVNPIFKQYFLSELELSRDDRPVAKGRDNKDLRFFKGILGEKLHNDIITTEGTPEEVYTLFETKINEALKDYVSKDVSRTLGFLNRFGIIEEVGSNKYILENVDLPEMDGKQLTRELTALSVNYMIANIEMHKLLYSDPYQYKDELKRIKSFLSPRQAIINSSPKINAALNKVWNKGFKKGDVGYTNFTQDHMRTTSHQDVVGIIDLPNYENYEETDGGGIISYKAYRNFRIRAGEWNENEEKQYRYDVAWEKRDKGITVSKEETVLLKEGNPAIKSAYTSLKPIVSGAKKGYTYNNVVLDKYALYPLSYRVMKELNPESNAIKLYNKMQRENIDYIVFESGRKVGAEKSHATYVESAQQVKEGVSELFESNPELANAVYEALGVVQEVSINDIILETESDTGLEQALRDLDETKLSKDFIELSIHPQGKNTQGKKYVVSDGWHRLAQAVKNNDKSIKAFIGKVEPQKQQAQQLYSQYLDTIFPDSKVQDIVYHGTKTKYKMTEGMNPFKFSKLRDALRDKLVSREISQEEYNKEYDKLANIEVSRQEEIPGFEQFDKSYIGKGQGLRSDDMAKGFYFGSYKIADRAGTRIIPAILNIEEENNTTIRRNTTDFDTKGDVFVVFEPEQIHILGSKQDIKGFKKFASQPTQQSGEGVAVFNDAEYESVVNVPLSIMSLQSDVPSKEQALVTRGSQVTKLITMDYMDNGVPFDYKDDFDKWTKLSEEQKIAKSEIYKEIAHNQRLLEEMTNEGYQMILKRLGIKEEGGEFNVEDFSEATKTLRDEMFKREINDNVNDALTAFLEGKSILEATPSYQQVRNILYSIVDKQIVRPKISGGMKVQIPSSLFESNRIAQTEINGKKGYTSDILKFYENKDGERVMEIMVGRWFQSDMSDAELLDYLNNTKEGQKILSGLSFRIPTQRQNSIDAFRIKQFLPKEFGDNVVVPAAIVKKVGSDFDIDKLSIYLKNVFYKNGELKLVPFYGFGQQAKDKFAAMFDSGVLFNKEQQKQLKDLQQIKSYELSGMLDTAEGERFNALFEALGISQDEDALSTLVAELKELGVKDAVVNRMYKQSLENEYIQSSENLVSHPANFERLISPNSAEQLKGISKTIVEKVIGSTFDYTAVDNMLDRRFMSRLRQAFVSGKRAIGIAAVNQTNHSLNQRASIYIDKNRLDLVNPEDAIWLGDGNVNFQNYNKVTINGQEYPTLSGVENADGQLISDILGQFIDGYVDISKGPWIMEMGATPNVASTFMFLVKIGVPVDTVAYFMNQPIIRDYIQSVENAGYSWLFIDDYIDATIEDYGGLIEAQEKKLPTQIPSKASLLETLGKTDLNAQQKLDQIFMLKEFLKYAKMANQLYTVTQGSNWDTSTFNDPFLVFKKNIQYAQAKNTIISSVDDLLNNSFIANQATKINDSRDALSNFLTSDKGNVRSILQNVLTPYVGLPNRTFVKVARKAVNDLFDWAVQTDQGLNLQLQELLLSDKGVASDVISFIDEVKKNSKHPLYNNQIIDLLQVESSRKGGETTPNNISLKNTDNKVYDQNNIIYAFRDLKEALKDKTDLYDKIVTLSILQSGLNSSPISFTSLIPYEDFARIYNKTLPRIENIGNLNDFYELGIFQRNNWSDNDIVPNQRLFLLINQYGASYPSVDFLPNNVKSAIENNEIPQVHTQKIGSRRGNDEYVVSSWNKKLSRNEIAKMRKAGDYSYINKGLFKKVYDVDGDPYITTDKKGNEYYVYKAVNAWGDSFRANEFYSEAKQSIIDNGLMKVNEVMDAQVVAAFESNVKSKSNKQLSGNVLFTRQKGKYRLMDGNLYDDVEINKQMLLDMGYTDFRANSVINTINKFKENKPEGLPPIGRTNETC